MRNPSPITTLFLDIGGVLLTDGWKHQSRQLAAKTFRLDWKEMEARHRLVFETFEEGKLTLEEYLGLVVFHQPRTFTRAAFRRFMFAQSKPYPRMIALISMLRIQFKLKVFVVSNEARELNAHRIRRFGLSHFVDAFVSSCFVHTRKPDPQIFRLALDFVQARPAEVLYIENTPMFVKIAEGLGMRGLLHTDYPSTRKKLAELGLRTGSKHDADADARETIPNQQREMEHAR